LGAGGVSDGFIIYSRKKLSFTGVFKVKGLLQIVHDVINVGAKGVIMGRNIWGYKNPAAMVKALVKIVCENLSVEEALKILETS
jgi:hypothetical protein